MPTNLRLIDEKDQPQIEAAFQKQLAAFGYTCTVKIGPAYDTDHNQVTVATNIPHDKITELAPMLIATKVSFEEQLGEAMWEWEALCKCGNQTHTYISEYRLEENEEYDIEVECNACRTEEFMENRENTCRLCGKRYNPYKSETWNTRLEAYVCKDKDDDDEEENKELDFDKHAEKEEKRIRAKAEIYEIGFNIHRTPMDNWELCCRDCAKNAFKEWLTRVLNHPFTKECMKE